MNGPATAMSERVAEGPSVQLLLVDDHSENLLALEAILEAPRQELVLARAAGPYRRVQRGVARAAGRSPGRNGQGPSAAGARDHAAHVPPGGRSAQSFPVDTLRDAERARGSERDGSIGGRGSAATGARSSGGADRATERDCLRGCGSAAFDYVQSSRKRLEVHEQTSASAHRVR